MYMDTYLYIFTYIFIYIYIYPPIYIFTYHPQHLPNLDVCQVWALETTDQAKDLEQLLDARATR